MPRLLCRAAVRPCQIVTETLPELPEFLDCANDEIFSDDCDQDSRSERAKFNASTACVAPLTLTSTRSAFWPGSGPVLAASPPSSPPPSMTASTPSSRPGPQSGSLLASLFALISSLPVTVCGRTSCAAGTEWGGTRSPARGRTSPAWRSSSWSTSSARRRPCGPKLKSYQKAKDRDENRTEEEERQ